MPDGSAIKTRVTAVLRRDDGTWKLVHAHFSVGVPDEEVVELQKRWGP
jgi:ketosteroid isomerase-like protein